MTNCTCPHCDRPMKQQKQFLNKGILISLLEIYNSGKEVVHFQKLFNRDNSKMCNAQKLKYFNLIENVGSGHWKLTDFGKDFIEGNSASYKECYVFNNKVIEKIGFPMWLKDMLDKESYSKYYRERPDYRRDSKPHRPDEAEMETLF